MGDSRPRTSLETRVAQLYNYETLIWPRTGPRQHAAGVSETDHAQILRPPPQLRNLLPRLPLRRSQGSPICALFPHSPLHPHKGIAPANVRPSAKGMQTPDVRAGLLLQPTKWATGP